MKTSHTENLKAAALVGVLALTSAQAQTVETRIGKLEFEQGVPTKESVTRLYDEMDFQRGCQAYLWGLPIVASAQAKLQHELNTGARDGDIAIYEGYRNVSVWLTANATTPYIAGFVDLSKSGPIVLDIPAGALAGTTIDFWQRPISDLGAVGPDQGKGARFLFVGPGQEAPAADDFLVFRSPTFNIMFYYRALDADPQKAEATKRAVRVYPYSRRKQPPVMKFVTPAADRKLVLAVPPRGMEYWERLADVLAQEPVEDRDRFFIAMLRPLGFEKGKPFNPDQRQRKVLTEAARLGEAMAKANSFDKRLPGARYRPDAHWDYATLLAPAQDLENYSQLDERAAFAYELFGMTKAAAMKIPGVGQAYLAAYHDKDGHAFDGGKTYRLRVPPNPPAKQFWSVTLYEVDTRILLQNKEQIADRSSRMDLLERGRLGGHLHGAEAAGGFREELDSDRLGQSLVCLFPFLGPLEPYFDQSWSLPNIEKVKLPDHRQIERTQL